MAQEVADRKIEIVEINVDSHVANKGSRNFIEFLMPFKILEWHHPNPLSISRVPISSNVPKLFML